MGYQWAARCYPHALDRALFSPLLRHFLLLLFLPRACSRSHAIACAADVLRRPRRRCVRDEITAGPRYFFLISPASFFSHGRAIHREGEKIARRVTTSSLRDDREYVRAYVHALLHDSERKEVPRRPGKDFLGDVRKSPRSRSRIQNKARHAIACHASCITSSSVARLICIILAPDSFSFSRSSRAILL